ncbi:helix-turn-helix domain-containing protein [Celeribacter sp.]|uniref:helix-turn-helix domain-containing protein n=1 Tax=Celeribacter sp. TaxID=1890673 RepID=UPI003A92E6BB
MANAGRGIKSIEVSGRVLSALMEAGEPMMLRDIAEQADLKPALCHACLTSMKDVGLAHQDPATGLYHTGHFAIQLGRDGWPRTRAFRRQSRRFTLWPSNWG